MWPETKITIRPSSVDTFFNCAYQWYNVFILGKTSIPSARAAIGTAIHAAAEVLWTDAILSRQKDANLSKLIDAAIINFQEQNATNSLQYDKGENQNTAEAEIANGTTAFVEDIVPFTAIPIAVEKQYSIQLDHPVVEQLRGTIDYISTDSIADIKTSRRKAVPSSYTTQQSLYKLLADHNGHKATNAIIQNVVLKQQPQGHIFALEPNVPQAKHLVNSMLDTLAIMHRDMVAPTVLFRGNPKYYLCDEKYCAFHSTCPYVNGELPV
jgi:hypothetical protein